MTNAVGTQDDDAGWFTAAVAGELRAQMARQRVSGRELGRRLHVSAQWISQRTKGAVALSTDEIERICACLEITPMQLLQGAADARVDISAHTHRYKHASSPSHPGLYLVKGAGGDYRPVSPTYRSTPSARANAACRLVVDSSGTVNDAHSA